jgi:hypothetical protein
LSWESRFAARDGDRFDWLRRRYIWRHGARDTTCFRQIERGLQPDCATDRGSEFFCRLESVPGRFGQGSLYNGVAPVGQIRSVRTQGQWRPLDLFLKHGHRRVGVEWEPSREQPVEDETDGV